MNAKPSATGAGAKTPTAKGAAVAATSSADSRSRGPPPPGCRTGVERTRPVGEAIGVGRAAEHVAVEEVHEAGVVGGAVAGLELGGGDEAPRRLRRRDPAGLQRAGPEPEPDRVRFAPERRLVKPEGRAERRAAIQGEPAIGEAQDLHARHLVGAVAAGAPVRDREMPPATTRRSRRALRKGPACRRRRSPRSQSASGPPASRSFPGPPQAGRGRARRPTRRRRACRKLVRPGAAQHHIVARAGVEADRRPRRPRAVRRGRRPGRAASAGTPRRRSP